MLSQTYSNLELIIADDGSTDWTKKAVLSLEDPRIRYLELPHTGNTGKVRNAGAAEGKGEWIAFLDSDDIWVPRKLELQIQKIKETGKRWCYGKFELMDETGMTIPPKAGAYRPVSGWVAEQLLTNEVAVVICTLLVERKLFEETGGFNADERMAYRDDYEFAIRLAMKEEAVALPEVLVHVLEHPGRVTHSILHSHEKSMMPYAFFLQQNHDQKLMKIAKRRQAWLLSEAAVTRSATGDRRVAWNQLVKAAGDDNWRHWLSAVYRSFKASFSGRKHLPKTTQEI